MYNLVTAGLARLRKNWVFWGEMGFLFLLSAVGMLLDVRQSVSLRAEGYVYYLDDFYFKYAPFLALFVVAFVSLFLGTEYNEGTIRNKLVVGHSRLRVYLSNYLVCLVACEGFVAVWILGGMVGIPFLGTWQMGWKGFAIYALLAVLFTAALTGIFVLIAMLSARKSLTAVMAVFVAMALILWGSMLYNALGEPEMVSEMMLTADGIQMGEPLPNPRYVDGAKRILYQFLVDGLPTGQGIQMTNEGLGRPLLSGVASVVLAVFTTMAGIFCFRKKDLR